MFHQLSDAAKATGWNYELGIILFVEEGTHAFCVLLLETIGQRVHRLLDILSGVNK